MSYALYFAAYEFFVLFEVVSTLLDAHPEAAQAKDEEGQLPLHRAALGQASVEVVRALLDAHLEALQAGDSFGDLPLHCAAEFARLAGADVMESARAHSGDSSEHVQKPC